MLQRLFLFLALVLLPVPVVAQGLPSVTVTEAHKRAVEGKSIIVDIRTPEEWKESGTAKGAVRLDMTEDAFLVKLDALRKANPGKEIDLVCATAGRSAFVQQALVKRGWTGIVNVQGGMAGNGTAKGWISEKLPLEK